jgi:hypothetical protein
MTTLVQIARCALAALLLLSACSHSGGSPAPQPRRIFHVHDFGAQADHPADSGAAVRRAIEAAIASGLGAEVVFGEGTYRVQPGSPRQAVMPIRDATNLVVRGAGPATRILVTDSEASGFSFSLCSEVILRNLAHVGSRRLRGRGSCAAYASIDSPADNAAPERTSTSEASLSMVSAMTRLVISVR